MTLILASGDHHFERGARWAECLRIHAWIAERVEALRPALFVSAGDVYERASTPDERAAVAEWLTRVAAVCPVLVVRGNHDRPRDLELLGRLTTAHGVVVEERAGVHVFGDVAVAAVAWPSRAMLAAALGDRASAETIAAEGRDALRHVLRGLGDQLAEHAGPRLLVAHAQVVGARVGVHGQPLAPGAEVVLGAEDLAFCGADAVVLGHVHAPQRLDFGEMPIAYTGSPFRNSFGEAEEKSILALDFEGPRWGDVADSITVRLEALPTPCSPMHLVDAAMADLDCAETGASIRGLELARALDDAELPGAEIRLRYTVATEERDAARREAEAWRARWLASGAARVQVEERVIATTRARAPEVAAARTIWDQLAAHWSAASVEIENDREPRLRGLLAEIEEASA